MPRKPALSEIANTAQTLKRREADAEDEPEAPAPPPASGMSQAEFSKAGPKPTGPPAEMLRKHDVQIPEAGDKSRVKGKVISGNVARIR